MDVHLKLPDDIGYLLALAKMFTPQAKEEKPLEVKAVDVKREEVKTQITEDVKNPEKSETAAQEKVEEEPAIINDIEKPSFDKGVIKQLFIKASRAKKQDQCRALLGDFGVENLTALFDSGADLQKVYEKLMEICDA